MASSSKSKRNYDVFLSFRGMDLRNNFVSHLYQALDRIGIYTFRDSEELKKGDQILMLMKAIEESCIAIICFSENYASSTWCLEEVAKIMECKEQKNLIVLPVFYKVDPREVRGGRESYGKALAKHESKFGNNSEKLKRWKKTLFDAGSLSGWHLNDRDESELIQEIVKEISTHLGRTPLHVATNLVGIESRVVMLKGKLNLASNDDIVMLGLWGQGGIGKTTLAKAIYNSIFRRFEGSCFLANVREISKGCRGLITLQLILLNDILLPRQRLEVSNVDGGINLIQHRLGQKKVLVILDDVDNVRQLNALVGEGNWFGDGSRIIITTRDKQLLTPCKIDQVHVHEVKPLGDIEAYVLLKKHASSRHQKLEIKTDLVKGVLDYAKCLPLALEVLGSFLRGRREDEWESTLDKISTAPNKEINDVLRISYDGLEANEKEIFLHIACFFKGSNSEYVKEVLHCCNYDAIIGLQILIERSLIRIEDGKLQMHDLIQMMGKDIVNQGCDDPRRRSRLWMYDDVVNVLSSDMGDCAIKAMVLKPSEPKEMSIHPNAFTKMGRLRLLILHNVHNSFQGPLYFPNELRWIEWSGCGREIPKFSDGPKKLVRLNMSNCDIAEVVKQFKDFQQLKYIDLWSCELLISTPNVSCTPNLEKLYIEKCKNLVKVDDSVACHDKLKFLAFLWCPKLNIFPNVLKSKNLRSLHIHCCTKLERFPDIPHKLEGLKEIRMTETALKELPASIENLVSLERMYIDESKNLRSLPSNIYKLQKLQSLTIWRCPIKFPKHEDSIDPHMKTKLPNSYWLNLCACNQSQVELLVNNSSFPFLRVLGLPWNNFRMLSFMDKYLASCRGNYSHLVLEIFDLPRFVVSLEAPGREPPQTNGHLTSIYHLVRRHLTWVDTASPEHNYFCCIRLPREQMPGWLQTVKGGFISFKVSKDLHDKFLRFIFCVVFDNTNYGTSKVEIEAHFNGQRRHIIQKNFIPIRSNHISLRYCPPSHLWEVDFSQIDGSYAQCSLKVSGAQVKDWGLQIICKQLEDNLKVEIQENQLINLAFLYEVGHTECTNSANILHFSGRNSFSPYSQSVQAKGNNSIDPEVESSHIRKDSIVEIDLLKDLQGSSHMHGNDLIELDLLKKLSRLSISTDERDQRGSKRKHEFSLSQNKRVKIMVDSNLTDGDENGRVGRRHL